MAARKPVPAEQKSTDNFEDLLAEDSDTEHPNTPEPQAPGSQPVEPAQPTTPVPVEPGASPQDERVAALEKQLAEATAAIHALVAAQASQAAPTHATSNMTAEEKARAHQAALAATARLDGTADRFRQEEDEHTILIHVLVDGFTAFGRSWSKGQELNIGESDYKRTQDITGFSWLELRDDPNAQRRKWGEVKFASGEYPWHDGEEFDHAAIAVGDATRRRAVPVSGF